MKLHSSLNILALTLILCASLSCLSPVSVQAQTQEQTQQDRQDMINRLNQLDNQIQTLSHAVFKGDGLKPDILKRKSKEDYKSQTLDVTSGPADIEVRLSQLEREIRKLTGRIETQAHRISEVENGLQKQVNDLTLRVQDLEQGRGFTTSPTNIDRPATGANTATTPQDTQSGSVSGRQGETGRNDSGASNNISEQSLGTLPVSPEQRQLLPIEQYEVAFAKLKDGDYEGAEKAFRSFISENPEHRLISNARYWLGETFYVRDEYERAARAFARGYKENPSGAKAPDNLLKLGLSLEGLGNKEDACVALIQLTQKFPDGPRPVLNRASQEIERLDCSR